MATPLGRWESPADTPLKIPDSDFRFWLSPPLGFRFACLVPLLALPVCLLACALSCWGDLGSGFRFCLFACLDLAVLLALCLFLPCLLFALLFLCVFSVFPSRVFSPDSLLTATPSLSHDTITSQAMAVCEIRRDWAQETVTSQQKPRWRNPTLDKCFCMLCLFTCLACLHALFTCFALHALLLACLYLLYLPAYSCFISCIMHV